MPELPFRHSFGLFSWVFVILFYVLYAGVVFGGSKYNAAFGSTFERRPVGRRV